MRDQNYLAVDLELNNKNDGTEPKIIQVGACVGSPLRPDEFSTFSWYLDPEEPITPFITKLTGITDELIQGKAVPHQQVADDLGRIIGLYEPFVNPITWGQGDADELKTEFRERGVDFPHFGRRIFDVKTIFVFQQMVSGKTPSGGLRKSMLSYGLKFQGEPHRADNDALNTLRFFFHLLKRQKNFEDFRTFMLNTK